MQGHSYDGMASYVSASPGMFTAHSIASFICSQHLQSECFCSMSV